MTGELIRVEDQMQVLFDTADAVPEGQRAEFEFELKTTIHGYLARVDDLAAWFARAKAEQVFLKETEDRVREERKLWERKERTVRDIIAARMRETGSKKLAGRIRSISLNEGRESLEITDVKRLPLTMCSVAVTLPAVVWDLLRKAVQDPALGVALASAPVEISPDSKAVKAYVKQQVPVEIEAALKQAEEANAFDFAIVDEGKMQLRPEVRQRLEVEIREHVEREIGARIATGEPFVVVK